MELYPAVDGQTLKYKTYKTQPVGFPDLSFFLKYRLPLITLNSNGLSVFFQSVMAFLPGVPHLHAPAHITQQPAWAAVLSIFS
jgi:hypothetical protein